MNELKRVVAAREARRSFGLLLAGMLLFGVIARGAGDTPWKSKPPQQWDDNDIHKILYDSPWAHMVTVSATWRTPGDLDRHGLPEGSVPPAGNFGGSQPSSGGHSMSDVTVGSDRAEYPLIQYFVYWLSSKTVQEALARRSVLHAGQTLAEAEARANKPQPEYAVLIQSTDMNPFVHEDEKFFQANSFLQLKKSGQKVSPERVEFRRDADGKTIVAAVFVFAKTLPDGQALISADEKIVEFNCRLGRSNLKVTFDPQKMTTQLGRDL
jgi:hypothetical protein